MTSSKHPVETTTKPLNPLLVAIKRLSRRTKRLIAIAADLLVVPVLIWVSVVLKRGELVSPLPMIGLGAAVSIATVLAFTLFGLYRAVHRFLAPRAALAIGASVLSVVAALVVARVAGVSSAPEITASLIFGALLIVYAGASRMTFRWLALAQRSARVKVIVYGAGESGAALVGALATSNHFEPVAFVDDSEALAGAVVGGLRVHSARNLPKLIRAYSVTRALLAMPVMSRRRRREITESLRALGVHVQTMPSIAALVSGGSRVDDLQDVEAGDLLGRDPVPPNSQLFGACISGKNVLVTGAGGSIGSELCRQILGLEPARLLLLEMSELALYSIERELRLIATREGLNVEVIALLGNAHHKYRVREILHTFAVQTVYHAAAYKHVPIVEQNIIEGIHNNVFSTWYAAEAALDCAVETFVLVSTDKAVNPTNVMGATKRFAEIVLQGLQQRQPRTRFCMVRFGNVLESSGSVVPLFRDQIRRGGPVTVTHPDVIRYFMTIPEAAQLVMQAGSMATGGDVFVLDMGKPIRIEHLARRMIELSGLQVRDAENPDGDIEIHYTGLRPAEKLFEELLIGKNVTATGHPMIMRAVEPALPWARVQLLLEELGIAMRRFDCAAARGILEQAVPEYVPTQEIQDIVWARRLGETPQTPAEAPKVADLSSRRVRTSPPAPL